MNALLDLRILGSLLAAVGVIQWIPIGAALLFHERTFPLVASSLACLVTGLSVAASVRPRDATLRSRDGFLVVTLGWILVSSFGALPYAIADVLEPVDSLFEAVSGFTTTGSTVFDDIEAVPYSLLLWRSITQWLGGMGIIVFGMAILPMLGVSGMQLFKAEIPGPTTDKLRPRIASTARRLMFIYVGFTAVEGLLLWHAGLSVYEATCHALTTVSTGGFSTRNASVGAFESSTIEWIVIAFMLLGGINFSLHYRALAGDFRRVTKDRELRYFLGVVTGASVAIAAILFHGRMEEGHVIRSAVFQVVSIMTTTGFATADFDPWPPLALVILLQLMVLGGMAGSTSGGVKDIRVIMGVRVLRQALRRALHPRSIGRVKHDGQPVPADVLDGIWAFLLAYVLIAVGATAVMSVAGYDLVSAFTAALTAIGNVGPGLNQTGPTESFHALPAYAKLALSFCMIAGRLEIYTVILLLLPSFWRRG